LIWYVFPHKIAFTCSSSSSAHNHAGGSSLVTLVGHLYNKIKIKLPNCGTFDKVKCIRGSRVYYCDVTTKNFQQKHLNANMILQNLYHNIVINITVDLNER
jgi:hypothetical protein